MAILDSCSSPEAASVYGKLRKLLTDAQLNIVHFFVTYIYVFSAAGSADPTTPSPHFKLHYVLFLPRFKSMMQEYSYGTYSCYSSGLDSALVVYF